MSYPYVRLVKHIMHNKSIQETTSISLFWKRPLEENPVKFTDSTFLLIVHKVKY